MTCLEMSYHSSPPSSKKSASMSPRISFSNDFVESNNHHHHPNEAQPPSSAVSSSEFEFSVSNNSMLTADELFFKGNFLPYKDSQKPSITTLRQELLLRDDDDDDDEDEEGSSNNGFSLKPPKVSNRWKELLGLKKSSHIGSKGARACSPVSQGLDAISLLHPNCPKITIHIPTNAEGPRLEVPPEAQLGANKSPRKCPIDSLA